jgi:hypothetical protein
MTKKLQFYERYGVEEYYIYDPDRIDLVGLERSGDKLEVIEEINGWVSPRLGIRFELKPDTLEIFSPSGQRFLTPVELDQLRQQECQRADQERQRADEALAQLEQEQQRYQALLEQLRSRGIHPENL